MWNSPRVTNVMCYGSIQIVKIFNQNQLLLFEITAILEHVQPTLILRGSINENERHI